MAKQLAITVDREYKDEIRLWKAEFAENAERYNILLQKRNQGYLRSDIQAAVTEISEYLVENYRGWDTYTKRRNRQIRQQLEDGADLVELAERLGLTIGTLRKIART